MQVTSLGFQTDLALLRLEGSEIDDRGDHLVVRSPDNPDYWWGNFLLLEQAPTAEASEAWLDRFATTFPRAAHVALGVDDRQGGVGDLAWFATRGFTVEALTVMAATDVHEPANLNTAAVCRPLSSSDDWVQSVELRVRCNELQVDAADYRRFVTAKVAANRRLVEAGHGGWFGAFVDGQLVSQMGLFSAGSGLARFQSVETDPDYRRRGFAGTLVHYMSRYGFDELGARILVMVADPNGPAIDLYRTVGFVATETQLQIERPTARRCEPAGWGAMRTGAS